MQLVPGVSMRELNPADFPQKARQATVKTIIDIESVMFTYNVSYCNYIRGM
jgi:hypothetical protein